MGIPIELALAAVDQRLREEGIRGRCISGGGRLHPLQRRTLSRPLRWERTRCISPPAALLALGCHLCRTCQTGSCNWGIATQRPELVERLNPDMGAARLVNLVTAWKHEIKEMMGGMGINSIEALKGNRLMLRGVGMTKKSWRSWGSRTPANSIFPFCMV